MARVVLNTSLYASNRPPMPLPYSLDLARLSQAYAQGVLKPTQVVADLHTQIEASCSSTHAWIAPASRDVLLARAAQVEELSAHGTKLPLYGVPFAVKDNIDVAGLPTTAACPAFSYTPAASAHAVTRLEAAGAICLGKTNLDQFATGLVGTRSPYGACANPFDARYIAGGSSSGSALALALGQASFALGTDTAGSGRVPAAFCNVVGFKPTRGLIGMSGVVPACRSLDCLSLFALTAQDALAVFDVARGPDSADPYSRSVERLGARALERFRCGVPRAAQLEFFGDALAQRAFEAAAKTLESIGAELIEIDYAPFAQAAQLLYEGPWVTERLAAIKPFYDASAAAMHPVTREIIGAGARYSALDAFEAQYRLQALAKASAEAWAHMDVLAVPTTGTIYTLDEVAAEPLKLNSNLGHYTNFVNLFDLVAIAAPGGFREDGLPAGITLIAPALEDITLAQLAARFQRAAASKLGATPFALPDYPAESAPLDDRQVLIAVVGAHLSGMPLNRELTSRGARLIEACTSAAQYRLYALPETRPPKPGLERVENSSGVAIDMELWSVPTDAFGSFVAAVPPPLAIGTVTLADGRAVKGFVCEGYALAGARDISSFGGWRNYLAHNP